MWLDTPVTTTCSYRKTTNGTWVVCGPTSVVRPGATVTVTKKDGTTKTETIATTGKPFGDQVYGYPVAATRSTGSYSRRSSCPHDGDCWTFMGPAACRECGYEGRK